MEFFNLNKYFLQDITLDLGWQQRQQIFHSTQFIMLHNSTVFNLVSWQRSWALAFCVDAFLMTFTPRF